MAQKITKITWNFQPNYDDGWGKYYLARVGDYKKIVLAGNEQVDMGMIKVKKIEDTAGPVPEFTITFDDESRIVIFNPSEVFYENIQ